MDHHIIITFITRVILKHFWFFLWMDSYKNQTTIEFGFRAFQSREILDKFWWFQQGFHVSPFCTKDVQREIVLYLYIYLLCVVAVLYCYLCIFILFNSILWFRWNLMLNLCSLILSSARVALINNSWIISTYRYTILRTRSVNYISYFLLFALTYDWQLVINIFCRLGL